MPFFSFSLKKNFLASECLPYISINSIENDQTYFSKNTKLWKYLNKKKNKDLINSISFEPRKPISKIEDTILFCLPPSLGLGDIIEYALSINSIIDSKKFKKVGIAFIGKYEIILKKYFKIENIFPDIINLNDLNKFKSIFHVTLEIKELRMQKYIRQDIEKNMNKYFSINKKKFFKTNFKKNIKKITIFPISKSPLRSMSPKILQSIIDCYENEYEIDIVFDDNSDISKYLEKKINLKKCKYQNPSNLEELCNIVEKIEYGIFMDSGPLHLAKLLNKPGILIVTSVDEKILLNKFSNIIPIKNNFTSNYCSAPCGLTNIFNYKGKSGCYFSLNLNKQEILNIKNLNALQRGTNKSTYVNFISNPVGCIDKINIKNLLKSINTSLEK
tara:strand:- start:206 stop:1366 length:1161 start_codon:yes stop_codon:yes gene_type:complete